MSRTEGLDEGSPVAGGSMTKAALVEEVARVADLTKKHSEPDTSSPLHTSHI